MFGSLCVLGLALCVGLAHSWEFAVAHGKLLEFYTNDTKTNTVRFGSHNLGSLAYDEVHNMILYVDKQSDGDTICGYDISSIENECFIERKGRNIHGIAFDPATELLFFSDTKDRSINWISLKSGSTRNNDGKLLIKLDHGTPTDVAVDSCRGYVYWINTDLSTPTIERAQFNGSNRKVVVDSVTLPINKPYQLEPHSLTIDLQTQNMYWIEPENRTDYRIYLSDLKELNKTQLSRVHLLKYKFTNPTVNTLTVSKTNLLRASWCTDCDLIVVKLGKITWTGAKMIDLVTKNEPVSIVANYKIKEQIQDIEDCEALTSLERKNSDVPFCVHGVKVTGESLCKCTLGYIGERCDVSVCDNNYCLQGNCSVTNEGLPECRCDSGYSGERCEVNVCHGFCLNDGVCSLNEEDEPSCDCVSGYQGAKCQVLQTATFTLTDGPASLAETSPTLTDLLINKRKSISRICFDVDES